MGLTFSPIEGSSRLYSVSFKLLIILTAIGAVNFGMSYMGGQYLLGGNNVVPWGILIVIAVFLIGLSAGALIISTLTYAFGKREYRPVSRLAVFLALILIFGAMIAIGLDLGRPEKSVRLFLFFVLTNMRSMFAINGILYGGYFLICLVYLGLIFAQRYRAARLIGFLAIAWASLVHMGTGAIFGFVSARPIYHSPIRPFEFLVAALASGLALLIAIAVFLCKFTGRKLENGMIVSLSRILLMFTVLLTVLVAADKITHLYGSDRDPIVWLLTGPFSFIFWGLQVGCAYMAPIVLLSHPRFKNRVRWIAVASCLVVLGIFGERLCLVVPGTAYPLHFYPGKIEGNWGAAGTMDISLTELSVAVGIFSLMGIFFLLGLKHLQLIPGKDADGS